MLPPLILPLAFPIRPRPSTPPAFLPPLIAACNLRPPPLPHSHAPRLHRTLDTGQPVREALPRTPLSAEMIMPMVVVMMLVVRIVTVAAVARAAATPAERWLGEGNGGDDHCGGDGGEDIDGDDGAGDLPRVRQP